MPLQVFIRSKLNHPNRQQLNPPNRRQSVIVLEGSSPCVPVMSLSSGKPDTVDRMLTPSGISTVKVHCPLSEVTTHPVPVDAPLLLRQ